MNNIDIEKKNPRCSHCGVCLGDLIRVMSDITVEEYREKLLKEIRKAQKERTKHGETLMDYDIISLIKGK